ncbi:MAG TPA: GNAT family N-acetyltransferase [Galbitalea sp.]|jgi:predicted acetyltransferase
MSDAVHGTPIDEEARANLAEQGLRFTLLKSGDGTFEPWFQAMGRGFYGAIVDSEVIPSRAEGFAHRRLSGIYDDTLDDAPSPVATASSWLADLTVPGERSIPTWAISTITVAPTHRRRGIARNMMEAELRTASALGVPAAILTASEATIYERFGFAPAAMRADWTIDTTKGKWAGPIPNGRVQLVTTEQGRDGGGHAIFDRARLGIPGEMYFEGHLWRRLFGMPGREDPKDLRVVRYDDADGVPQGLAIYKVTHSRDFSGDVAEVAYLTTATDDAYAALWRYLVELDLVDKVEAPLRSVDEPVRWQLTDSRAAVENRVGDHLWLRVLDVKATLEARRYNAPGAFVLELDDPLGFADSSWLLTIDDAGKAVVAKLSGGGSSDGKHRLAMNIRDLGAIYLGGTSVATLVRAGRIVEKAQGSASAADAAFRSAVTPWLSTWF